MIQMSWSLHVRTTLIISKHHQRPCSPPRTMRQSIPIFFILFLHNTPIVFQWPFLFSSPQSTLSILFRKPWNLHYYPLSYFIHPYPSPSLLPITFIISLIMSLPHLISSYLVGSFSFFDFFFFTLQPLRNNISFSMSNI